MINLSDFCEHLNKSDLAALCDFVEYRYDSAAGLNIVDHKTRVTILQVQTPQISDGVLLFSDTLPELWGTYESEKYAPILRQFEILIRGRNLKIDWVSPALKAYLKP